MKTKFKPSTTLREAIDELEYNNMNEITRIMSDGRSWVFEYNIER